MYVVNNTHLHSLDAYLSEMQQQGSYSQYAYRDSDGPDLMGLAAAPLESNHDDNRGQHSGSGEGGSVYDDMSAVLMHREKEFLGFLCQPLEDLEENIAELCIESLADELRSKVVHNYFFQICMVLIYILYFLSLLKSFRAVLQPVQFSLIKNC